MFDFNNIVKKVKEISTASEKWEQGLQDSFVKEVGKILPKPAPSKGKDIYFNLWLCWQDADRGCTKEIRIPRLERMPTGALARVIRILKFTIPKGQGHQSILKLKEHGDACEHGGNPGDLFAILNIPEDDKDRQYNELNNDIFTNFQVASANIGRDLSKMLCLTTEVRQVFTGDTVGEDLRLDLEIGAEAARLGCDRELKIPRLGMTEMGKLDRVIKSLTVTVPAGAKHHGRLRLKEQGDACRYGGKSGDLYIHLLVSSSAQDCRQNDVDSEPEPEIKESLSRGEDIQIELEIEFNDAARGCTPDILVDRLEMTAAGKLERVSKSLRFAIPAGTQHDSKLRLKEQGNACRHGGKPGDLYLHLLVKSPAKNSDRQDPNFEPELKIDESYPCGEDIYIDLAIGFDDAILGCDREIQITRIELIEDELEYIIKSLTVTIPAGTVHGSKLRLKGQGHACQSGSTGDLYLYLLVPYQDKDRKRNGINIEVEIKITSSQASEGGEIVVNTPTGWRTIFISPGTKTGDCLVLSGCGVYRAGNPGKNGDYIIKFVCE